jgi:hypothetical protein
VQNHGFASIGSLSESLGSQRFGTSYRYRDPRRAARRRQLPVDLAANAASLGADVVRAAPSRSSGTAWRGPGRQTGPPLCMSKTDPLAPVPSAESWWDVPVSEISALESTQKHARPTRRPNAASDSISEGGQQVMRTIQHWIAGIGDDRVPGPVGPGLRRPAPHQHGLPDRYLATEGQESGTIRCQRRTAHVEIQNPGAGDSAHRARCLILAACSSTGGSRPRKRDRE